MAASHARKGVGLACFTTPARLTSQAACQASNNACFPSPDTIRRWARSQASCNATFVAFGGGAGLAQCEDALSANPCTDAACVAPPPHETSPESAPASSSDDGSTTAVGVTGAVVGAAVLATFLVLLILVRRARASHRSPEAEPYRGKPVESTDMSDPNTLRLPDLRRVRLQAWLPANVACCCQKACFSRHNLTICLLEARRAHTECMSVGLVCSRSRAPNVATVRCGRRGLPRGSADSAWRSVWLPRD